MARFYYYCKNCVNEKGIAEASGDNSYITWLRLNGGFFGLGANCKHCGEPLVEMDAGLQAHFESFGIGRRALKKSLAMGR